MRLHLYNPSHDDALASGRADYNAPRAVRQMERDLALLPAWWAAQGEGVAVPDARAARAFARAGGLPAVPLVEWTSLPPRPQIVPWGWNASLVRRLRAAGVAADALPDAENLAAWRRLSSRATAVKVLRAVRRALPGEAWVGRSRTAVSMDEVARTLAEWPNVVVKAPWSCSGRGVFGLTANDAAALARTGRLIARQGFVELEPRYCHTAEWAMLFTAEPEGDVRFAGLSLFAATVSGRYVGNVVAPQAVLRARAEAMLPAEVWRRTAEALQQALAQTLRGAYVGRLGVDMMVCPRRTGSGPALHPCVEVNLRPTMGFLAMALAERLQPAEPLHLAVQAARTPEALRAKVQALRRESGASYRPLTPFAADSLFHACLTV